MISFISFAQEFIYFVCEACLAIEKLLCQIELNQSDKHVLDVFSYMFGQTSLGRQSFGWLVLPSPYMAAAPEEVFENVTFDMTLFAIIYLLFLIMYVSLSFIN